MMITKAHNEKRKIGAVNIKAAKKYVVTATITGFMNAQRAQNESGNISRSPQMNGRNMGENRQAAATANHPAQMGDHNENNRDDMSRIS